MLFRSHFSVNCFIIYMVVFDNIFSTCVVYTKTSIHLGVSEWWWIFTSPLYGSANVYHYSPLDTSVNNCSLLSPQFDYYLLIDF